MPTPITLPYAKDMRNVACVNAPSNTELVAFAAEVNERIRVAANQGLMRVCVGAREVSTPVIATLASMLAARGFKVSHTIYDITVSW